MKRLLVLIFLLSATTLVYAQQLSATAQEQARMKPLVATEVMAREALNAKIAALPEAKAYNDAREALNRATEALNKAAEALPENLAWKAAGAAVLDEAYRIQATHNLSSREYRPELNDKTELVFTKIAKN